MKLIKCTETSTRAPEKTHALRKPRLSEL